MTEPNINNEADMLNYRALSEAARNNTPLTPDQEQQLSRLASQLNLPNPLATQPVQTTPSESEFLQTAKQESPEEPEEPKKHGFFHGVISAVEVIVGAVLLAFIINQFIFQPYEVVGISMQPTLENGDRLIVSKIPSTLGKIIRHKYTPHRYDIVVLKDSLSEQFVSNRGDLQLVKRVIGLAGDKVVIKDGHITIYNQANPNGFNPDEKLVTKNVQTEPDQTTVVPVGQIFVCGDNRPNSLDSRSEQVGTVPVEHVVGHVTVRILPLNKAKIL